MENPILDFSATLAKPSLVRVDEALRARVLAERARLDREQVKPVPVSRRQRKRSLTKVCEVARKAGADHVIVDGVVIAFSPAASAAVPESYANEWDVVLPGGDHGPH